MTQIQSLEIQIDLVLSENRRYRKIIKENTEHIKSMRAKLKELKEEKKMDCRRDGE